MRASILLVSFLSGVLTAAPTDAANKRSVCTPLTQVYEDIDDSVAINSAIADCGDGGTIILPQDQIYSIRSQIDLTPCKSCDFQIEGRLIVDRGEWAYWNSQGTIIKVAGVHEAKIRSLTGKGIIDGNAIDWYFRDRWAKGADNSGPHFLHITAASSNILIENLTIKNVPLRFFRADSNSTNLTFSRLTMTIEDAFHIMPIYTGENIGFELGDVSDVTIDSISMDFTSSNGIRGGPSAKPVGVCVAFDRGTNGITVKNIKCNAWGGVLVMLHTFQTSTLNGTQGENYNRGPALTGHHIQDIHVSNLTFSGASNGDALSYENSAAAGFLNAYLGAFFKKPVEDMRNITWDGVTVLEGKPLVAKPCYYRCWCPSWPDILYCPSDAKQNAIKEIRFLNFRGKLPAQPDSGWACVQGQVSCDVKIGGWTPDEVVGMDSPV